MYSPGGDSGASATGRKQRRRRPRGGRAAGDAQTSYQQAVETSRKPAAQLRGAAVQIRELAAKIRHHEDRADRVERWSHHVSVEIEEKFFGRDKAASR